jgi:hypothetical protein
LIIYLYYIGNIHQRNGSDSLNIHFRKKATEETARPETKAEKKPREKPDGMTTRNGLTE